MLLRSEKVRYTKEAEPNDDGRSDDNPESDGKSGNKIVDTNQQLNKARENTEKNHDAFHAPKMESSITYRNTSKSQSP